jgi:type I restriction enzyme R subunit
LGAPRAKAYFGVFRLVLGNDSVEASLEKDAEALVGLACEIDKTVNNVVAENTLNPSGIDSGIRKRLLPELFSRFGLDAANAMLDKIIHIVRVGFRRD